MQNMIKLKLAPDEDGTYKSAQAIGNNVEIKQLSAEQLKDIIATYPNVDDYVWAQEEPKNMGAYGVLFIFCFRESL